MDDLDHSVLISERDWDSFFEESEECCIQQARLAGLDDSGLSDTDDEKNAAQSGIPFQPVLPLETNPRNSNEEHNTAVQTLCKADGSEDSECLLYKMDLGQTAQILTSDSSVNEISPNGKQNNVSSTENFKEHEESESEDKLGQVMDEPKASSSCTQDTTHATGSEGETAPNVTESLAVPKKEKERWFVTVNDGPNQQRVYSGTTGQKKRKKKKSSRKRGHLNRVMGGQCPRENNETEAEAEEMKEGQKAQNDYKPHNQTCPEHSDLKMFPDCVNEEVISGPITIKEGIIASVKEPGEEGCEMSSLLETNSSSAMQPSISEGQSQSNAFSIKHKGTDDVPTENQEKIPSASLNLNSSFKLTHSSQDNFQDSFMTQLANDQSIIWVMNDQPKSNTEISTQTQSVTNISTHVHDDPKENGSSTSLTTASSGELQEQDFSAQSHHEKTTCSLQETQNQEKMNESLNAVVGPSHPIYALSSFWDEMERLTINDILHLRVANNRSLLSGGDNQEDSNVHLGDSNLQDSKDNSLQDLVDDAADSDYFTQVDESKPDRSSCEFSTFSDFDEEFLQIINTANPTPEPQNIKEQTESISESTYMSRLLPEQQLDLSVMSNESKSEDIIMMCPQDGMPLYLYPATQSLLLTCKMDCKENPFEMEGIRKTPSPVLSVGNILDDDLSFSEIFNDIDEERLQTRTLDRCNSVVTLYSSKTLSVPETYDDFFTDFVVGNLLFPSVQDQTAPVPIFSSSHSVVRDMVFPEAELIESDIEDDDSPIRVMTPFGSQLERSASPSGAPNIYFFTSQRRNWRSLFSLRRLGWCQKVSSWIFPKEARKVTSYVPRAQPTPHLFHIGDKALIPFVELQKHVPHTASISSKLTTS